jgi:type I restriction enzyme M protein
MALKKSELYSSLWASCDALRGSMEATQYKDYVLVMLFVKYVSDKYAGQVFSDIKVPEGATFSDMVALKGKPDIGDQINKKIIAPLANANKLPEADFPDFSDPTKLGSGQDMVDRLTNLIGIFENPALNFSKNRTEGDDLLGDAYEFLMRHFAAESGKSKGQFYTPAEVSRIMAQIIGIRTAKTSSDTTVYDPTCGSGSLLLKVAAEAPSDLTLYGQEYIVSTATLARMNMILHDCATAQIEGGASSLSHPRFKDGLSLKTFDYVVANPPFSDKAWITGFDPENDEYRRFSYGVPPKKQGDYAFLLHIVASLKSTGKGACILPHGVLFRGNAEAVIRKNLIQRGYIKAIIGLPANLFYGTGIPACIVLVDKEGAADRRNILMIDASKGFAKDGPKNRLREQDIHKIVDVFTRRDESDPKFARVVPISEISDPKNDYNLNLPRYIDSTEPEDLQDLDGHLRGGIPVRDIDALSDFWAIMPNLRATLFEPFDRPGYVRLKQPISEVKSTIFAHPEFVAFHEIETDRFNDWAKSAIGELTTIAPGCKPKELIEAISEGLLKSFKEASLLDGYDVYQHIRSYWSEFMQDDCYLISEVGWKEGATPHEIFQRKNKDGKPVWSEKEDFKKGNRRFKSDLIPAEYMVDRYFSAQRETIIANESDLAMIEQNLEDLVEEYGEEEGALKGVGSKGDAKGALTELITLLWRDEDKTTFIEFSNLKSTAAQLSDDLKAMSGKHPLVDLCDKNGKLTSRVIKERLNSLFHGEDQQVLTEYLGKEKEQKEAQKKAKLLYDLVEPKILRRLSESPLSEDLFDLEIVVRYLTFLDQQTESKSKLKTLKEDLDQMLEEKYSHLTEDEIKTLVVEDKWIASISNAVQCELDQVSQTLTGRIRQLAERYAVPLPQLTNNVALMAASVDDHLRMMGLVWS